jgi:hypothetical protein
MKKARLIHSAVYWLLRLSGRLARRNRSNISPYGLGDGFNLLHHLGEAFRF